MSAIAAELTEVATREGFPNWVAQGLVYSGWTMAQQGEKVSGIARMREGVRIWDLTGAALIRPFLLYLLAGGMALAGRHDETLETLDTAAQHAARTGEIWFRPELHRFRGEVLAAAGSKPKAGRAGCPPAHDVGPRIGPGSLWRRGVAAQPRRGRRSSSAPPAS